MATTTTNKNYLSPVGFMFTIDRAKYPNTEYFCSGVTLPGVTLAESPVPFKASVVALPGDRLDYSDLTITFNVTEDLDNYNEIYTWMENLTKNKEDLSEQATLSILNSHNNVTKNIVFKDVFPVSLDGLEFNSQNTEVTYLAATATFGYTSFEIK